MQVYLLERIFFILMLVLSSLLAGCGPEAPAPVVNAWLESGAQNSVYIVGKDDTLYSIAWQFGLDYSTLARINHLSPPYSVHPGQRLKMTNVAKGEKLKQSATTSEVAVVNHWIWPAQGKVIAENAGVDIEGRENSAIKAAQAGEVVYCGNGIRSYGNLIIIKHNRHYLSAYAHNRQVFVHLGQKIQTGETIATMGKDDSGQIMLHFEIRYDGRPVDTSRFLS